MKKIIFLYLSLVNLAFAYNYDEVLLKAQASIFPKIMLLDKKIENKLVDGEIVYTIVYNENDYQTALDISNFITDKYKGQIGEYSYTINLVALSDLSYDTKASSLYVLDVGESIQKVADIAKEKGIISFSYDINNLKRGLLFSLSIEKSTVLYLKKENLYSQNVDFVHSLLQIVRFVYSNSVDEKIMLYNNLNNQKMYAHIEAPF